MKKRRHISSNRSSPPRPMKSEAVSASPLVTASCTKAADICESKAKKGTARPCEFIFREFPLRRRLPTKSRAVKSHAAARKQFTYSKTTSAFETYPSAYYADSVTK